MGRGQSNERIELPCKFGTLVCEVVRNDDEYRELAIDLYRNDGKAVQVCVVGSCEDGSGAIFFDRTNIHVTLWDGEDEDSCFTHYTEPFGEGYWGEWEI